MSFSSMLSAFSALVALALIVMLMVEARRYGRTLPSIVWVMCSFIGLQGLLSLNRLVGNSVLPGFDVGTRAAVLDGIGTALLIVVLFNARKLGRIAQRTFNEAQYRASEYERARRDYTQVVRHRVMNPLTVIRGAVATLRAGAVDKPELAEQLLEAIDSSAQVIQHETLVPERRDALEHDLDAVPRVSR